ncbi:helix-turn-helix domain-containing protein [Anaeromassilibacillus senegalensis]|uniref:helix-turn-helix domain-containing protein n=1 Tax=Anaeromassilibacillus senegalensis TaxID=1673717 RepID=UPI00068286F6|nr:helix-turn-helix domain-containing protein [Anaeromassilibacillus senegalensis]
MISYAPFYRTLKVKRFTEYQLIKQYRFSANILFRMKQGKNITLKTLNTLCAILDCRVEDIVCFVQDKNETLFH